MTTTAGTPKRILLGEGVFILNYKEANEIKAGVTRGGGSFNREVEIKEMEYDGSLGFTKGMRRKTRAVPQLKLNSLEIVNADTLTKYFAGLQVDDSNVDYDSITAKADIEDEDFLTNVAFVGKTKTGKEVVIIVKNALGDGNLEFTLEDGEEVVHEIQFTGHYDLEAPTVEPFEIRYPKVV